ncbi:MAG: WD40/YVTN/BNR-like repeat-containing protein [Gemmatimonadaceae bacterium]
MRTFITRFTFVVASIAASTSLAVAQSANVSSTAPNVYSQMHWREIGPTRAGRARALAGVPSQPNVFYIGFDNGGVWRSTDYGSNWEPLFDQQPTGSIGAIAVAQSDPNIIYVGSGAGIIRPDLAVGDGVYKSIDAGKTWTHLGLRDSQMIAMIDVDPKDPNRIFVAALGHPYGPNAERGIFRSTDGGRTFQKVLYKDEYTSGNDVRIDPNNSNVVYATLWQQQQSYIEGAAFGGAGNAIFKSTDGGTTWKQLAQGLPPVIQANIAIAPSNSNVVYAMVAGVDSAGGVGRSGAGVVGFYKSTDAGEHWHPAIGDPSVPSLPTGAQPRVADPRPLVRIGGGDLPTIVVDPKNENVVYSSSTVFWRTEDAGLTWSAVRGSPGGDDYQKTWINPNNTNIILAVSDQGAVISANRGVSWSNWYTQPTAAMYHVSTDDAFPYRVCGGQQDSGSACVDSRSMDGEITFHDWHPVNIQEYGIAASDPTNPDLVFGSMRTNVSLYNRRTAQTTLVGPSAAERGANFNRNVRTMPITWSPADSNVLFYTSNVVWKTLDRGHTWSRISPDLARQSWAVPANTGKYASTVTPSPQGSITALSPSPRDANVIWAGTDDGNIQMTMDGGARWTNVTPPQIKPWTRIFNMDAGHFDVLTAYAAANTLRLDDLNPHFWRTHDGGKSWTEINRGIASGAVANSIREDPRKKGLLYASTDTQVWVSFDDGDHWQSLKLDMPAISVRDIQVKDDSTCLCSDLVAATHGRGFWILDNVTPLRGAAETHAATGAYLVKPITAVRVRFATNDPTPWPPELPAGENPPPGAIIDYYLAANAAGPVALDVLDAAGKVVRSYSSADSVPNPDPALNPTAYNRLCQRTPNAADCDLPLYWPAPPVMVSNRAGMHRFSWDMRYNPIPGEAAAGGGEDATGAVPHRTYPAVNAPWAPPGAYTVRLSVAGKSYTQPLTLRLDPRVTTPAAGLAQLASLSREMYDGAVAAHIAYTGARALSARLDKMQGSDVSTLKAQVEALAPALPPALMQPARGANAVTAPTLESASRSMLAAAMAMQGADVTPTASEVAATVRAREQYNDVMARWTTLKTTGLATLNAARKAAGQSQVTLPELFR